MLTFFFRNSRESHQGGKNRFGAESLQRLVHTDIHSHLLPGIDDGSKTLAESAEMIRVFQKMGYKKLVTTPHIMSDFYRNTPEIILGKLAELKKYLREEEIHMEIEAAAEYYLDDGFLQKLKQEEGLLTFGDNYVLFETAYLNAPYQLWEAIFEMQSMGYRPILAHPERYVYIQKEPQLLNKLLERDVLLQINLNSLMGHYSKASQEIAERLVAQNQVSFIGSDCHRMEHLDLMHKIFHKRVFSRLSNNPLLNNTI